MKKEIANRMKVVGLVAALAMTGLVSGCVGGQDRDWQKKLAQELPVLGHRNWIVIADSAYPAQSRPGIETIATGADQIRVVKAVLSAVDDSTHVRANVYLDTESEFVSEKNAPGIDAYRNKLAVLLGKRRVNSLPHEEIIAKLDEAAKTFRVLVLKTNLTLPYTSVFLELDCGYWSAGAEGELRQAIREGNEPR